MVATICSLRPNVTREDAARNMSAGISGLWQTVNYGHLRALADVYIPYRVFRSEIRNGRLQETRLFGLDAVEGSLDVYNFGDRIPQTISVETGNRLEPALDIAKAQELLGDKLRRLIFRRGFFRVRELSIRLEAVEQLYIPYWAGFCGPDNRVHLTIMDAIRRRLEGAKVRHLVHRWLAS